jgi:hypothetical protein
MEVKADNRLCMRDQTSVDLDHRLVALENAAAQAMRNVTQRSVLIPYCAVTACPLGLE